MTLLSISNLFHKKYDGMKEPWRFLLFFIPAAILVTVASSPFLLLKILGIVGLTLMFVSRLVFFKTTAPSNAPVTINVAKENRIKKH